MSGKEINPKFLKKKALSSKALHNKALNSKALNNKALSSKARNLGMGFIFVLTLTSCGVNSHNHQVITPTQAKISTAIDQMISGFQSKHPELVNWNAQAVESQLHQAIPAGTALNIGWLITWRNSEPGQLPQVIIPWNLLGITPKPSKILNNPESLPYRYTGGSIPNSKITSEIAQLVSATEMKNDSQFAAVFNIKESTRYPQWIIFSTEPYLPVTDPGYGFATVLNGTWSVVDFGTAKVGCDTVPALVEQEFGFSC